MAVEAVVVSVAADVESYGSVVSISIATATTVRATRRSTIRFLVPRYMFHQHQWLLLGGAPRSRGTLAPTTNSEDDPHMELSSNRITSQGNDGSQRISSRIFPTPQSALTARSIISAECTKMGNWTTNGRMFLRFNGSLILLYRCVSSDEAFDLSRLPSSIVSAGPGLNLCSSMHRRLKLEFQWFIIALSVLPGKSFAIEAHLLPWIACRKTKPIPIFALENNPNFDPNISLFGDARVDNGTATVYLTRRHAPSSGLLLLDKPFRFVEESNVGKPMSFSTEFSFSLSPGDADDLALVFVSGGFHNRFNDQGSFGVFGENLFLGIEFNENRVGIDVGSLESVKVCDLLSLNLVLNNGEPLKSWVDYDSASKILQIRLSKSDEKRPFDPILAYRVDLLEMWGDKDVYVDPRRIVDKDTDEFRSGESEFFALTFLAGLIFGTGCGALFAFMILFMWAILISRHRVFPIENQASSEETRYEKIDVIVEKDNRFDKI
ncbi:Detected protein of unknown function [Hibiscus syriacus]|uniref:Legume lectin domain-containing protein n=1 Tax=Hibiscus syriacus TaxID=106335 RepID=A0A6A3D063_HIBSY|nr:Detected protein of unknown function [Hibiscus syriacus]